MVSFNDSQVSRTFVNKINHIAGRHVPNAIVKAETVHDIFVPTLPEKAVQSLSGFIMSEGTSWSTALAINTKEVPGRRRKDVAWCMSMSGINYYVN